MTVLEVLIAISIMAVISALGMNVLRVHMGRDTDITKFKHAFATLSEVVYSLKNDASMYPTSKGFADMSKYTSYANNENASDSGKEYAGSAKFKKLFTSKFNVLERDVSVDFGTKTSVPLIRYEDTDENEHFKNAKKIKCFIENKGFMFCPPETDITSSDSLTYIYVPMYVSKIDINDNDTMGIKKAVFVEISNTGKIEIPALVYYDKPDDAKYNDSKKAYCKGGGEDPPVVRDKILIDCTNKEYQDCMEINKKNKASCTHITDYNSYNHCKILDKIMDINF